MADTGYLHDEWVQVGSPDIGAVTREAQARGYKLPGEAPRLGEAAHPSQYYYRHAVHDPSEFVLALKPAAPADATPYRARVVAGEFKGLVDAAEPATHEVIPVELPKEAVVARLRETEGFGPYAEMLETHGIASRAAVNAAVTTFRGRKNQSGNPVTLDWLRHEVKDYFRTRVLAKLLDPALDDAKSYVNMRAMLDGLGNADRGALAERWYQRRHAPDAKAQVKYQVTRTSGENEGQIETRAADLVVGREAREVKDIEGKIDEDQFGAYLDALTRPEEGGARAFDKLRYVFTKPEGAIANLRFFAKKLAEANLRELLTVEVFDTSGISHTAQTSEQAFALLNQLLEKRAAP